LVNLGCLQLLQPLRSDNRAPIGDPDAVDDLGNGRGIIRRPAPVPAIHCMKMQFEASLSIQPKLPSGRALFGSSGCSTPVPLALSSMEQSSAIPARGSQHWTVPRKRKCPVQRPVETEIRPFAPFDRM
jgi:hypothetical protein